MSDPERQEILLMLGRIDERTLDTQQDVAGLRLEIRALQEKGCPIGAANATAIKTNATAIEQATQRVAAVEAVIDGMWRRAVVVMVGVGTGAVATKEGLAAIFHKLIGG